MKAEARFAELGLELPPASRPVGTYRTIVQVGDLCYLSGHGPLKSDRTLWKGRVGDELTVEEGSDAARQVALAMLATLKSHLGSLDRVARVVRVFGMVHATPEFAEHPRVMDGFSDLLVDVFGEDGRGVRSAVGMSSLPENITVEVEATIQVRELE